MIKFDFDDILLTPETISNINSRKEVNPFDENGMLPIFTAPMDTVVSEENKQTFIDNKINVCLPRNSLSGVSIDKYVFRSYGLETFEKFFVKDSLFVPKAIEYALLDVANGHMKQVHELAEAAKKKFGDGLVLMVGNIANPMTFEYFSSIGVDYVRCGIGGGSGCLTSVQTGVGYPMGSLISECSKLKAETLSKTKIVADGGFNKFADINKALALGADYVMLGGILNKALESAGETYEKRANYNGWDKPGFKIDEINDKIITNFNSGKVEYFKKYRGMSTKEVQRDWGKTELKTSEGIVKYNKVLYTLSTWAKNMEDYLRSAMSYTGSSNLEEFKHSRYELITQNSFARFNK
jgi:IMP dehydrogenase/GMP reductase